YVQEPLKLTHLGYPELATPGGAVPNQQGNVSVYGFVDGLTVSSAVFGQIEYQFTDQWKVTVGARYNKDEKDAQEQTRYVANNLGLNTPWPDNPAVPLPYVLAGLGGAIDVTPPVNTDPATWAPGVRSDYRDPISG